MGDTCVSLTEAPPTEPGFYHYDGGAQTMVFLLDRSGQWYTIFDNGTMDKCHWSYIDQALSVFNLIKIRSI